MAQDHVACARRTMHAVRYITIATVCPGEVAVPWNTPVFAAFDAAYRFFWVSDRFSRHSENIRNNPNVFLAIYDSTIPEGTGDGQGVYVQARAAELAEPEQVESAHRLMAARSGRTPRPARYYLGDMPGRIYRAEPERLWVNDAGERDGLRVDARYEVDLAALRAEAG